MIDFEDAKKEWLKLGYTDQEATELTNIALSYKDTGTQFDSAEDATKWLMEAAISSMKFDIEETQRVLDIIDKLNEVDCINPIPYEFWL